MKKKRLLAKISLLCSLALFLTGCTTLSYIDNDIAEVKSANIQTNENFSLQTFEKQSGEQNVKIGISETVLENALVLYIEIINNSELSYRFDLDDLKVSSPDGEISFIPPAAYIDAFQSYEAQNYAGLLNAGAALNSFASIQSQYRRVYSNSQNTIENMNQSPELQALENTIQGIQRHSTASYKFLEPKSNEYFYVFLRKPEEYPVIVEYKNLTYKFGNKKNAQTQN